MKKRKLGKNGPELSAIGLGCMGMSEFYGKHDDAESEKVILRAIDNGITMFDTAESYGQGHNEELLGRVLSAQKEDVFIATKFGIVRRPGEYRRTINNSESYIRAALEGSLRRLRRDYVDLYYVHRLDQSVPVEDTMGVLSRLVAEGKIRHIGLSEVSARTIRRAHAVHPLCALQSEYSLFTRDAEKEIIPTLNELGIGFVPYCPLGRGFLTGTLDSETISRDGDFRGILPRSSDQNREHNQTLVRGFAEEARRCGVKPSQLAIAWVLAKGESFVPIPGTKRECYLMENIASTEIELDADTRSRLENIFYIGAVKGARYTEEGMVGIEE
ncbi:MAG TPA: aldo/keto reductase [Spirochaetota bacterium]